MRALIALAFFVFCQPVLANVLADSATKNESYWTYEEILQYFKDNASKFYFDKSNDGGNKDIAMMPDRSFGDSKTVPTTSQDPSSQYFAVRLDHQMYWLDRFDAKTGDLLGSLNLESDDPARIYTGIGNALILARPSYKVICNDVLNKLDSVSGKETLLLKTQGIRPSEVFDQDRKTFVLLEHGLSDPGWIKRHPDKVPYGPSAVEAYDHAASPNLLENFRFGGNSFDTMELSTHMFGDPEHSKLYAISGCTILPKEIFPTINGNEVGFGNLQVINTKRLTVETIPLGAYLRDPTTVVAAHGKVYISSISTHLSDGGAFNFLRKTYRQLPYLVNLESKLTTDEKAILEEVAKEHYRQNWSGFLYVFSQEPFHLIKVIKTQYQSRAMAYISEDGLIAVMHRDWPGSKPGAISFVDVATDKLVAQAEVGHINLMGYAGNHRLLVSTTEKLVVFDTKTQTVFREYPGNYTIVSEKR